MMPCPSYPPPLWSMGLRTDMKDIYGVDLCSDSPAARAELAVCFLSED